MNGTGRLGRPVPFQGLPSAPFAAFMHLQISAAMLDRRDAALQNPIVYFFMRIER